MPASISKHDAAVAGMFGRIARFYDLLNHVLSLGIDCWWRKKLAYVCVRGPKHLFLDLAAGTLDVSLALRKEYPSSRVLALDFCEPMLERGQEKLRKRNEKGILPIAGDAKHIPLADKSVDSVTIAFGIRNIVPRSEAFAEMYRVLVPGGRVCILEFGSGRERIWAGLYNFYLTSVLPWFGRLISKDKDAYTYLARTICAFPSAEELKRELEQAGFQCVWYKKLTSGIVCLHVGEKGADSEGKPHDDKAKHKGH